jgi:hypothetical protein
MPGTMLRSSLRIRLYGALLAAALLVGPAPRAAQPAKLRQLAGVDEMKSWFNAHQGHPRVLFLLSPT